MWPWPLSLVPACRRVAATGAPMDTLTRTPAATCDGSRAEARAVTTPSSFSSPHPTPYTPQPLMEEVDPSDPAAAALCAEPLSADQAAVPDTDRPVEQARRGRVAGELRRGTASRAS